MTSAPVAFVVGGSRGIGAAPAAALATRGYSVLVAARHEGACRTVVAAIEERGGVACACVCDVRRMRAVGAAVAAGLRHFGRIDAVVYSAGVMDPIGTIETCGARAWKRNLAVNLTGAFHVIYCVLPHMRERNEGVIVHLSSGAGFHALEGWSAYCVAKAGLAMLTRVLAAELAGTDIRAYGFQPGMVRTDMTVAALHHKVNRVSRLDPETFDPPHAPAAAIAWLCQERPPDLHGREISFTDPAIRRRVGLGG